MKKRTLFYQLLLLIVSIFITFLFLEIGLRLFDFDKIKPESGQIVQLDPMLYRVHIPNHDVKIVSPFGEYGLKVKFNSQGLRGKELSLRKEEKEYRILVLGDSFIEARQVSLEATLAQRMEDSLNNKYKSKKFQVINAGVSGYSPVLEYLYFKEKGLLFKPDLVLVYFCFNDVTDDWDKLSFAAFDEFDLPVKVSDRDKEVKKAKTPFVKRLALWKFVAGRLKRLKVRLGIEKDDFSNIVENKNLRDNPLSIFKKQYSFDEKEAWNRTEKYLAGIKKSLKNNKMQMALLVIPAPPQVGEKQWVIGKQKWGMRADEIISSDKMQRILMQFCERNGIHFLDLLPAFKRNKEKKLFFNYDGHWTEAGNKIAAEETVKFLEQNNLLKGSLKQ